MQHQLPMDLPTVGRLATYHMIHQSHHRVRRVVNKYLIQTPLSNKKRAQDRGKAISVPKAPRNANLVSSKQNKGKKKKPVNPIPSSLFLSPAFAAR